MPNITWLEPQIFMDLLAVNYFAEINDQELPGQKELALISPWISNVELTLRPSVWHQNLTVGKRESNINLNKCIKCFCEIGWNVHIAVLQYGKSSSSGLYKDAASYKHESNFLKNILNYNANVYFCSDLHAKGIVTPLGIITGGTNITHSGLYLQSQNSNYFSFDHPEYESNRIQLMAKFSGIDPVKNIDVI